MASRRCKHFNRSIINGSFMTHTHRVSKSTVTNSTEPEVRIILFYFQNQSSYKRNRSQAASGLISPVSLPGDTCRIGLPFGGKITPRNLGHPFYGIMPPCSFPPKQTCERLAPTRSIRRMLRNYGNGISVPSLSHTSCAAPISLFLGLMADPQCH